MLVYQCTEGYMPEERMEAWCINGQWTPNPVLLSCSKDSSAITTAVSTSVSSSTSTSACYCSCTAGSEAGEQSISTRVQITVFQVTLLYIYFKHSPMYEGHNYDTIKPVKPDAMF